MRREPMPIKHYEKWDRFKRHEDHDARADLIREYVPLVHFVVRRMTVKAPRGLDREDLVAAGSLGLINAVQAFDLDRGIEFSTFAVPRIRGAVLDEIRKHHWVSRTTRRRAAQIREAVETCRRDGELPDFASVAKAMNVSLRRLSKILARIRPVAFVPLDGYGTDDELTASEALPDDEADDPRELAELAEQCDALEAALQSLPEVQRNLIIDYYFEHREQKDIARQLRVSRSRVSQIHGHALRQLRKRMRALGAA
jgi:RNA polymerase sigma factor for flagellar operon FliA